MLVTISCRHLVLFFLVFGSRWAASHIGLHLCALCQCRQISSPQLWMELCTSIYRLYCWTKLMGKRYGRWRRREKKKLNEKKKRRRKTFAVPLIGEVSTQTYTHTHTQHIQQSYCEYISHLLALVYGTNGMRVYMPPFSYMWGEVSRAMKRCLKNCVGGLSISIRLYTSRNIYYYIIIL